MWIYLQRPQMQFCGEGEACFPVYSEIFSSTQWRTLTAGGAERGRQQPHLVIELPLPFIHVKPILRRHLKAPLVCYSTLYTFLFHCRWTAGNWEQLLLTRSRGSIHLLLKIRRNSQLSSYQTASAGLVHHINLQPGLSQWFFLQPARH